MTREEQLAVMLANALIDKEEYKQSSTAWYERWEDQKRRIEEVREQFADAFADAVKELTDVQKELDRYHAIYGKKGQLEVADEPIRN